MAATFSGRNCVFWKNSGAIKTFFLIRVGKIRDSNEIFLLSRRKKQASVGNMKWRGPYSTLFKRWILMGGGGRMYEQPWDEKPLDWRCLDQRKVET